MGPLGGTVGPHPSRTLYEKKDFPVLMGNGLFQWRPDFAPGTEQAHGQNSSKLRRGVGAMGARILTVVQVAPMPISSPPKML